MTKAELAELIDAYAASKASGNKYLVQKMISDLEMALEELFDGRELAVEEIPEEY